MRDAVIFDMDGTLANVAGIRHYITEDAKRKNFEKFHGASIFVPPINPVLILAHTLHEAGLAVIVVTARKERWRYITRVWLNKWGVEHAHLMMRGDEDHRKDVEVKRDILAHIRETYRVVLAVDDNPAIVELWNDEGIPAVTVPGWEIPLEEREAQ